MKIAVEDKYFEAGKLYGSTVMGAKGQVVIPVNARRELGLNPGDRLLVLGKYGKALGLIKADMLDDIMKSILESVEGAKMRKLLLNKLKEFKEFIK